MNEQEIEAEAERLHKIGTETVQRMREEHGMTHNIATEPEFTYTPEEWEAAQKLWRRVRRICTEMEKRDEQISE